MTYSWGNKRGNIFQSVRQCEVKYSQCVSKSSQLIAKKKQVQLGLAWKQVMKVESDKKERWCGELKDRMGSIQPDEKAQGW